MGNYRPWPCVWSPYYIIHVIINMSLSPTHFKRQIQNMRHFQVVILGPGFINKPTAGPFSVLSIYHSLDWWMSAVFVGWNIHISQGFVKIAPLFAWNHIVLFRTEAHACTQTSTWSSGKQRINKPHRYHGLCIHLISTHPLILLLPLSTYPHVRSIIGNWKEMQHCRGCKKTSIRKRSASGSTQWLYYKKDEAREIYC